MRECFYDHQTVTGAVLLALRSRNYHKARVYWRFKRPYSSHKLLKWLLSPWVLRRSWRRPPGQGHVLPSRQGPPRIRLARLALFAFYFLVIIQFESILFCSIRHVMAGLRFNHSYYRVGSRACFARRLQLLILCSRPAINHWRPSDSMR